MKTLTAQLAALFTSGSMNYCGLYQFKLSGGGHLYYASGDSDIYLNAAASGGDPFWANQLFTAGGSAGPYFDRKDNKAKMHNMVGLQVDTLVFDVIPGSSQVSGAPFLAAVREGVFDGAELTYLGAYWAPGPYASRVVPTGTVKKYVGNVGEVDISRNLATFTVNSYLELLNQNLPVNLYQATCANTLYDQNCTVSQSAYATAGAAAAGSSVGAVSATLSAATGYFNLGVVTFTSGANAGVSRTVKQYTKGSPGTVTLIAPLPSAPAAGDAFDIYPGCDKTQLTCAVKFNNLTFFRGFPYVPQVEAAS